MSWLNVGTKTSLALFLCLLWYQSRNKNLTQAGEMALDTYGFNQARTESKLNEV